MQVSLCTRFPHLLKTRTVLSRRIQGTRLTPPTLGSPKNITVVFKAFKKNENKSHQVDILLVLTDVGFFLRNPGLNRSDSKQAVNVLEMRLQIHLVHNRKAPCSSSLHRKLLKCGTNYLYVNYVKP